MPRSSKATSSLASSPTPGPRRPLFEFLAYTGLRIGEALGLTWADVDYEHGPLKTPASRRTVDLAPTLVRQLRERWLASRCKTPTDFGFGNTIGRGIDYRDVGEDFRATLQRSGIAAPGRLTLHSFRHGYASLLISSGLNVVYVSRQLGHANPAITLKIYAHLYAQADHAATARAALDASYTAISEAAPG